MLAPKSADALDDLVAIYSFMDDRESTSRLVSRTQNITLDLASQTKQLIDYRNGVDHEEMLENSFDFIKRSEEKLTSPVNIKNDKNNIILNSYILSTKRNLFDYGKPHPPESLLSLARSNFEKDGSSATRSELESVLKYHMLYNASQSIDGYSEFLEKYRLVFGQSALLCISLSTSEEFKAMVLQDPLADELQAVIIEGLKRFPESANAYEWKILHELGSDKATAVRDIYKLSLIHI